MEDNDKSWIVVDSSTGKKITEKPITEGEAKEKIKQLKEENPSGNFSAKRILLG